MLEWCRFDHKLVLFGLAELAAEVTSDKECDIPLNGGIYNYTDDVM